MGNLKEVARALGFEVHQDTNMFYYGEWLSLDEDAAPLIIVYGKGGIMEKKGWYWEPIGRWWGLKYGHKVLSCPDTRDPQVVIDAYLATLPREQELPDLSKYQSDSKYYVTQFERDMLAHIKSLTADVAKLKEGK